MTQSEIYTKLTDLKANSFKDGVTALELALETGEGIQSIYRNLRDLIKNKRIKAAGQKYWIISE